MTPILWLAIGLGAAGFGRWRGYDPHTMPLTGALIGMIAAAAGGLAAHTWGEAGAEPGFLGFVGALVAAWAALVVYYAVDPARIAIVLPRNRRRRGRRVRR